MIVYLVWAGHYDCGEYLSDQDLKFITGSYSAACKFAEALDLQSWDWTKITTEEVEL